MKIWVDADACPNVIKDILFRASNRTRTDLVLVEGFKHMAYTRIELHRPSLGHPLLYPEDDTIIAVAADAAIDTGQLPLLDINDTDQVAEFVANWLTSRQAG